jgi:hypothetical protein
MHPGKKQGQHKTHPPKNMLLTEEEEEEEDRFMTDGKEGHPQQPQPENPVNLFELYTERQQIIEDLFYQGIGKPIYAETGRKTRVNMDKKPGESYIEMSQREVIYRKLIGVAIPTGNKGEYVILGENLDQVVVKTRQSYRDVQELAGRLDELFGPEGEGLVLSFSEKDREKPFKAMLRTSLSTAEITSSIDDPERVQNAVTSAIEYAKTEAERVFKKKIEAAQIANDAFKGLLKSLNPPEASSPSDEGQE